MIDSMIEFQQASLNINFIKGYDNQETPSSAIKPFEAQIDNEDLPHKNDLITQRFIIASSTQNLENT